MRNIIKIFWTKIISYRQNKKMYLFQNFQKAPQMRCHHCHILTWFRWKPIGKIIFIREISIEFLCGPRCFLLVNWQNSWSIVLAPICFTKLLKNYWGSWRNEEIFRCPSNMYCKITESRWSEVDKIVSECVWRNLQYI